MGRGGTTSRHSCIEVGAAPRAARPGWNFLDGRDKLPCTTLLFVVTTVLINLPAKNWADVAMRAVAKPGRNTAAIYARMRLKPTNRRRPSGRTRRIDAHGQIPIEEGAWILLSFYNKYNPASRAQFYNKNIFLNIGHLPVDERCMRSSVKEPP